MAIERLGALPGFQLGGAGPVLISVFHHTATVERLTLFEAVQTRFVERHPRMFGLNVIVANTLQPASHEVKRYASKLQQQFDGQLVISATVLQMQGLSAAIARGFFAALALMSGGSKNTQLFSTCPDALRWLRRHPEWPTAELAALTDAALAAFVDETCR